MSEEQVISTPEPAVDSRPNISAEELNADLQKFVEQNKPTTVTAQPTQTMPAQTVQPEPTPATETPAVTPQPTATDGATPTPEVPEKFKTPDGKLDEEKLAKSTFHVDQALAKYLEKEKELKRKQNEVRKAENPYLTPTTPANTPPTENANLSFDKQLEADVQAQGLGPVLAKLFTAAKDTALEEARKELSPLKEGFEAATSRKQIEDIGKTDAWVYTEEGVNTLQQILAEQPYMWQASDPYKAAYLHYQGIRGVTGRVGSQVRTPTPPAKATAPVPSAVAANPSTPAPVVDLNSREAISRHLKTLTPKQQEEFFKKQGYPAFPSGY